VACPAICREPAAKPEHAVCLTHLWRLVFRAAAQPIVGKPDSYALRAEAKQLGHHPRLKITKCVSFVWLSDDSFYILFTSTHSERSLCGGPRIHARPKET